MLVNLLMKKNGKLIFCLFIVIMVLALFYGGTIVFNNLNDKTYTFSKDGYTLYLDKNNNSKANTYNFSSGSNYSYKKYNNSITLLTNEGNINVDNNTVFHYTDGSLGVLKKTVGLDITTIDSNVIFYYNIYKNTIIKKSDDGYLIESKPEDVKFNALLLRVNDNKFVLAGNNVRLVTSNDEIVDFGNYAEFEYIDGSVVKIYNNEKYFQTISSDSVLTIDDVLINLKNSEIYKKNKKYISLTNLVIDSNSNVNTLIEEPKKDEEPPKITESNVNVDKNNPITPGNEGEEEEKDEESENKVEKEKVPTYTVSDMKLTSLKIDAKIEIEDTSSVLISNNFVKIMENSTAKAIYEEEFNSGDTTLLISYANLKPDTEYTLMVTSTYKIEGIEYTKDFVSKIFRTEALGINVYKSYSKSDLIAIEVNKESYSKVTSAVLSIYDSDGNEINYFNVTFNDDTTHEYVFNKLDSNTNYIVKLYDILCDGVIVDNGFSISQNYSTLKLTPTIGNLSYEVNKKEGTFNLSVSDIDDPDYGIFNYRYEIFDAREDATNVKPALIVEKQNYSTFPVNVDESKLYRGIQYRYRVVIEFNDNEKVIEYTKELGTTMSLDGVNFPTVRFDDTTSYITWEQINGTIIIDDPSGTIVSNEYKIVYKNSLGTYTSIKITADSDTGNIPICINNLRANETYTFEVYGSVNLQDGNSTADLVYIGSVYVQTKEPKPLVANFASIESLSDIFLLNFILTSEDGSDASLEADTLNELTFTVYQGSTVSGTKEADNRVLDKDSNDYVSSIKANFYDSNALINPAFFSTKNSDFTEKTYTIQITNSYDYTSYNNEIPILNNTFTFSTNNYIPDLPEDTNKAMTVNKILNKNATLFGLAYDNNLDANMVVGYNVLADYDNDNRNAMYAVYHTWGYNQLTDKYEKISALDKTVYFDEDGNLPYTTYNVGYGTSSTIFDSDMLRRGNDYYFSYEVYLDVNNDGEYDHIYPTAISDDIELTSDIVEPLKQQAKFKLYPSKSDKSTYTWKYTYVDYDNSLVEKKLYGYVGTNSTSSSSPAISVTSGTYNSVTFTNLTANKNFTIKRYEQLQKNAEKSYEIITSQYFYDYRSSLSLTYSLSLDVNKLVINLDDYYNKVDLVDSIANVSVKIIPIDALDLSALGTKTISNLKFENGALAINFFDINEYLSTKVRIELTVFFDSGATGFDTVSEYHALQKSTITDKGTYYYISEDGALYQNSVITNSMFISTTDIAEKTLSLLDLNENEKTISFDIDETGIVYDDNNLLLKELKMQTLTSDDSVIKFDLIIPGISMLDGSNRSNIVSLLDSATVKAKIIDVNTATILDNLIYIELYKINQDGIDSKLEKTYTFTLDQIKNEVRLDGLEPTTNYYIQFYSYVYDTKTSANVKKYLYDVDNKTSGFKYKFYTLSDVGISNVNVSFNANSYSDKKLNISYDLEVVYGYDHIEYEIYKLQNGNYQLTNIKVPNSTSFFPMMNINLDAAPGKISELNYGEQYMIKVIPIGYYTNNLGEESTLELGRAETTFSINKYETPYIGIVAGKTDNSIYFRVSISDKDFLVKDDKYDVKLLDESNNVLKTYTGVSTTVINKKFEFKETDYNLKAGEMYTLVINAKSDTNNSGTNFTNIIKTGRIEYGNDISLGTVTVSQNIDNSSSINVVFSDSYRLTDINKIIYSVSGVKNGFYESSNTSFDVRYDADKELYYYTINIKNTANYSQNIIYTVSLNFYINNEMVAQKELEYYYISQEV